MMAAAESARTNKIPYFGICYGFQWAVVEFARNVCGLTEADSTEVTEETPHKVIYKLRDLLGVDDLGGTMRLGSYACRLAPDSLAFRLYGEEIIHERHRHRYEFNCLYEKAISEGGLRIHRRIPTSRDDHRRLRCGAAPIELRHLRDRRRAQRPHRHVDAPAAGRASRGQLDPHHERRRRRPRHR